jgi:resuscitation-promoting factor RpfC
MPVRLALRHWVLATVLALAASAFMALPANAHYGPTRWDCLAHYESTHRWHVNTGNGHYGGLQFKPATWSSNGGVGSPSTASRAEQIRVAENVLRTQGLKAWPKCGPRGATPAVWNNSGMPAAPAVPAATTGCAAMPSTGLLGFINPRQMCTALLKPLGSLTAQR